MSTTTAIPTKPRTPAQIAASQANGALSKGPLTAEGKAKISTNRMTHGFRSNCITLANEDHVAYDHHLDQYLAQYAPINKAEEDLVGLLASSMWQIMRNNSIEVALFDLAISGIDVDIKGKFQDMDEYGRLALAFQKSAGDNALELLRRYKSTAERAYHRALQAIEQLQKNRQPKPGPNPSEDFSTVQTQAAPVPQALPITKPTAFLISKDVAKDVSNLHITEINQPDNHEEPKCNPETQP